MILFVFAAAVVASVPLTGGSLRRLAHVELRGVWLAPLALALQIVIFNVAPGGNQTLHAAVHMVTYALLGGFVWCNRRLPNMWLLGLGCAANVTAIAANRGVMPQANAAHRLSHVFTRPGFDDSRLLAHPHLLWLGDIIPAPAPFGLGNVLSIGDVLLFAGMLALLHALCRPSVGGGGLPATTAGVTDRRARTPADGVTPVMRGDTLAG